jgi:hypothetical protein
MTRIPSENRVIGWRCFHCGEYFNGKQRQEAADHFGTTIDAEPACRIATPDLGLVRTLRDIHEELRRYQEEDTDLHRRISELICKRARAVQDAEELGYSRGLRDGRRFPAEGEAV